MRVPARAAIALLVVAWLAGPAAAGSTPGPKGWYLYQQVDGEYAADLDRDVVHSGTASGRLSSAVPRPKRYGLLAQLVDAAPWRGKRVRFTATVRTSGVTRWSGLFLRVDGPDRNPRHALALDAMQRRPLRGTLGWQRVVLVLDVAPEASQLALGASLNGPGTIWIDDAQLEEVDRSVPTTGFRPPPRPQNVGFED